MGAIQSSINSVVGTVAAAAVAADNKNSSIGQAISNKTATAEEHLKGVEETNAAEMQKANTDVGNKELQEKLGKMELSNPSESNPDKNNSLKRMAQSVDAKQARERAQAARKNLAEAQKLQKALIGGYNLHKAGMVQRVLEADSAINVNPITYKGDKNNG